MNVLFFIALCFGAYSIHTELLTKDIELRAIRRELGYAEETLLGNDAIIEQEHKRLSHLQSKMMSLLPGGQNNNAARRDNFNIDALYKTIVNRQNATQNRIDYLQENIANLHREEAIEQ